MVIAKIKTLDQTIQVETVTPAMAAEWLLVNHSKGPVNVR